MPRSDCILEHSDILRNIKYVFLPWYHKWGKGLRNDSSLWAAHWAQSLDESCVIHLKSYNHEKDTVHARLPIGFPSLVPMLRPRTALHHNQKPHSSLACRVHQTCESRLRVYRVKISESPATKLFGSYDRKSPHSQERKCPQNSICQIFESAKQSWWYGEQPGSTQCQEGSKTNQLLQHLLILVPASFLLWLVFHMALSIPHKHYDANGTCTRSRLTGHCADTYSKAAHATSLF